MFTEKSNDTLFTRLYKKEKYISVNEKEFKNWFKQNKINILYVNI